MYFFKVKEINQILSMESKFPSYMDHCDAKIMAEDIEYLKRMYYYRTYSGKPELDQRMKLISRRPTFKYRTLLHQSPPLHLHLRVPHDDRYRHQKSVSAQEEATQENTSRRRQF